MRLCVPIPCFLGDIPFTEAVAQIAALGYDAAETYDWSGLNLEAVASACRENGVELVSMCTSDFRMTDPSFRQTWLEGLKISCEAANKVGAKQLITQVGPDTGAERALQHAAIVETLRQAKPILDTYGVTVLLEPLNVLVDHPGYYLTTAKEGFEIVREVDHPLVKMVYDIYHQQVTEGNIIPSITKNLDCIAHLHSAGHPGRIDLQFGENNYNFIFDAIDKAGYTGVCGLEYHPTLPPLESLKEARRLFG